MSVKEIGALPQIFNSSVLMPAQLRGKKAEFVAPSDTFELLGPKRAEPILFKRIAMFLSSMLAPGLGQIFNNRFLKGVSIYAAFKFLRISAIALKEPGLNTLSRILQAYAAYDAIKHVKRSEH